MVKKPLLIILPPRTIETQVLINKYQVTRYKEKMEVIRKNKAAMTRGQAIYLTPFSSPSPSTERGLEGEVEPEGGERKTERIYLC